MTNTDTTRLEGVGRRNSLYGNFTNGVNMMGFRVRNNGFLNVTSGNKTRYVSSKNYIEHDIDTLRSTLTLGDFFTSGKIFAAQNLRGAAMATNNEMLTNRERVYAPVITGVARSNATIIIKQNDFVIATRKVPPGPFALKDIPASSSAGDMDIIAKKLNYDYTDFMSYSIDFRRRILSIKKHEGLSIRETAKRFHIGTTTIVRWTKQIDARLATSRQRKIDKSALERDVEQYPDAYQRERAERFGVCQMAICKALKKLQLTYKKNSASSKSRRRR